MPILSDLPSPIVGTAFLWLVLLVAVSLSWARPLGAEADARRRVQRFGALALVLQGAHFLEEQRTGFHRVFPATLGLEPWSEAFFVVFNLGWILIWASAIVTAGRGWRMAEWPLWFLACALVGNGVAHPALALGRGAYFPGLVTAPFAGLAGCALLVALLRASADPSPSSPGGVR